MEHSINSAEITSNMGSQPKKERLFYLDFIRAIATSCIVILHFNASMIRRGIRETPIFVNTFANEGLGHFGVSLFFILSGASLYYVYQNNFDLKKYAKQRFKSIYPMFWTAYGVVLLYYFYIDKGFAAFAAPRWKFVLTIFGLDGYLNPYTSTFYILGEWFLGCIIILYILFPIIRYFFEKKPFIVFAASIVIYLITISFFGKDPNMQIGSTIIEVDSLVTSRLPELIFGMLFIKYCKKKVPTPLFLISFAALLVLLIVPIPLPISRMFFITITGMLSFISLAFIGQLITNSTYKKPFETISKYSYGIFLLHHVTIEQINKSFSWIPLSKLGGYVLFLIVCIVIALLMIPLKKLTGFLTRVVIEFCTAHKEKHS